MPVFAVQILNNTTPALSVEVADSGVPPVTYQQVKQSLGSQVYKILELYLYSENINQLMGIIQYQRFDSDGRQTYSSVATPIDPYAGVSVANLIDLQKYKDEFILNGNSSFSATILPNTYLQLKFWANRITNEFGRNLDNFSQIEIDSNRPNFFNNYGSPTEEILQSNEEIEKTTVLPVKPIIPTPPKAAPVISDDDCKKLVVLGFAALAMGTYMLNKED